MGILDKIEAIDITCHCTGCKEPMILTFVATKKSEFELISCYCPKCVIHEIEKKDKIKKQ